MYREHVVQIYDKAWVVATEVTHQSDFSGLYNCPTLRSLNYVVLVAKGYNKGYCTPAIIKAQAPIQLGDDQSIWFCDR